MTRPQSALATAGEALPVGPTKTNTYGGLLEKSRAELATIAQRRVAERLAETARNLESLAELADAAAREGEGSPGPACAEKTSEVGSPASGGPTGETSPAKAGVSP